MRLPPLPKETGLPRPDVLRRLLPVLSVFTLLCLPAQTARAHAILIGGSPAIGATLPPGRIAIELRFNSRIDRPRSRLSLIAPDMTKIVLETTADAPPEMLRAAAELKPGAYTLRWQVLAVDGHITRGDVPFTVGGK